MTVANSTFKKLAVQCLNQALYLHNPNPATDFVTIPAENYSVYNSLGILMGTYTSPHLQTTNFPNGVYFVRVGDRVLNFVK